MNEIREGLGVDTITCADESGVPSNIEDFEVAVKVLNSFFDANTADADDTQEYDSFFSDTAIVSTLGQVKTYDVGRITVDFKDSIWYHFPFASGTSYETYEVTRFDFSFQ